MVVILSSPNFVIGQVPHACLSNAPRYKNIPAALTLKNIPRTNKVFMTMIIVNAFQNFFSSKSPVFPINYQNIRK